MANPVLAWRNNAKAATIAAGAQEAALPASSLATEDGSEDAAWRTPDGVTTAAAGAWFTLELTAAAPWRAFLLARCNLSAAATVRWRVGSSLSSVISAPTYDSGTVPAGVVAGYGQSLHVAPAEVAGAVCRCDLDDSGNPQGFLSVALCYAGPVWQPDRAHGLDSTFAREASEDRFETRGGQEIITPRFSRRVWEITLPNIAAAEVWPQAMELGRFAVAGGNVLFVPDPESPNAARDAIFGTAATRGLGYVGAGRRRSWSLRLAERL